MYGATKQINFNMKKTDVKLYGITYTVRATTDAGLRDGIKQLKRSIERMMGDNNEHKEEDDSTGSEPSN